MINWAYINEDFVPEGTAQLSVRDLSILRGYGVFDFFRFQNFNPLFIGDHLDRLLFSMAGLGLCLDVDKILLEDLVRKLIEMNALPDGGIRITVTGGISENGFHPSKPSLIITQHSFDEVSREQLKNGIRLSSYSYQRQLPQLKTTDYIMAIQLQPWMRSQGSDDILYSGNGIITECPRSNIFIFTRSGQLCTPARNILKGITRKQVLSLASPHYPVVEKDIRLDEVFEASEAFITSTTKQVLPVRTINGRPIGTGQFPVSSHIMRLYQTNSSTPS
jgi:branched-chain amino acid aminotransferase